MQPGSTHTISPRVVRWGRHAALILLVTFGLAACRAEIVGKEAAAPATPPAAERPALVTADELGRQLKAAHGKPVVINFWATWCIPCAEEMPELARFHSEYGDRVTFISVSTDDPADLDSGKIENFMREHKVSFPVQVFNDSGPEALAPALGAEFSTLPATLVYALDGTLKQLWETPVTAQQLADAVNPLLEKPSQKN